MSTHDTETPGQPRSLTPLEYINQNPSCEPEGDPGDIIGDLSGPDGDSDPGDPDDNDDGNDPLTIHPFLLQPTIAQKVTGSLM